MSLSVPILVAAIDFGTTFSGYAFSFRHEFEKDPEKISTTNWVAGSQALVSLKTPSVVLLKPDRTFHSFGFEAENKYGDLAGEGEHAGWLYFKRFKMALHGNKVSPSQRSRILESNSWSKIGRNTWYRNRQNYRQHRKWSEYCCRNAIKC